MAVALSSALRFASALTRERDPLTAAESLLAGVRQQMGTSAADLAVLFISSHYGSGAGHLSAAIRDGLSPRVLVGCSGEGVIGGGKEIETGAAATLWVACLPQTTLIPLRLSFSGLHDRFTMAGWPETLGISPGVSPAMLLFADPFSTPMQELLPLLEDRYPGAIAVGGLAGGGRETGENQLILDDEIHDGGLVGVALIGGVEVRTVVSQGCRPIGDRYIITKAEQNVIHEMSGMPALRCLENVYRTLSSDDRVLAHRALHIGIAMDEHRDRFERGDFLVRNLIGADQESGAVVIGDLVQEGQTVQFQVRDAITAHEDLTALLSACRRSDPLPARGALLFSCCGRGQGLFGRGDHDVTVMKDQLGQIPVSGFFAQGEIGPVGRRSFLHGYTASLALFREGGRTDS